MVLALPYCCAESASDPREGRCFDKSSAELQCRKVEMIQIAAQRLIIAAADAYVEAEFKELRLLYEVFIQKLQYMLQISSQRGQPLCIMVLKTVLSKISELNNGKECPIPGITMPDDAFTLRSCGTFGNYKPSIKNG